MIPNKHLARWHITCFSNQLQMSFESLRDQEDKDGVQEKSKHADRFFREGRADQWKGVLTQQQADTIDNAHGKQMERSGDLP